MCKLFVYGTLLDPRVQTLLWGGSIAGLCSSVPGLFICHNGAAPRLMSRFGCDPALGRVLYLNAQQLAAAVTYEGPEYRLQTVMLSSGDTALCFV
jgi:hypothetical protein